MVYFLLAVSHFIPVWYGISCIYLHLFQFNLAKIKEMGAKLDQSFQRGAWKMAKCPKIDSRDHQVPRVIYAMHLIGKCCRPSSGLMNDAFIFCVFQKPLASDWLDGIFTEFFLQDKCTQWMLLSVGLLCYLLSTTNKNDVEKIKYRFQYAPNRYGQKPDVNQCFALNGITKPFPFVHFSYSTIDDASFSSFKLFNVTVECISIAFIFSLLKSDWFFTECISILLKRCWLLGSSQHDTLHIYHFSWIEIIHNVIVKNHLKAISRTAFK